MKNYTVKPRRDWRERIGANRKCRKWVCRTGNIGQRDPIVAIFTRLHFSVGKGGAAVGRGQPCRNRKRLSPKRLRELKFDESWLAFVCEWKIDVITPVAVGEGAYIRARRTGCNLWLQARHADFGFWKAESDDRYICVERRIWRSRR